MAWTAARRGRIHSVHCASARGLADYELETRMLAAVRQAARANRQQRRRA